jgi:hypothetical protein
MVRIDVEIDVDDMYWDMSRSEKQEMADKLYEDNFVAEKLRCDLKIAESKRIQTNLEQELSDLLDKIWDNRMFINSNDLEVLKQLSKKGLY